MSSTNLHSSIEGIMEIQQNWNDEYNNIEVSDNDIDEDETTQTFAEQFGLGITRQGGNS